MRLFTMSTKLTTSLRSLALAAIFSAAAQGYEITIYGIYMAPADGAFMETTTRAMATIGQGGTVTRPAKTWTINGGLEWINGMNTSSSGPFYFTLTFDTDQLEGFDDDAGYVHRIWTPIIEVQHRDNGSYWWLSGHKNGGWGICAAGVKSVYGILDWFYWPNQ